jgi:NitT/TauT family transport system substrate-binding protein
MNLSRRTLLKPAQWAPPPSAFPAIAQGRTKVKVGYLHTPAVDGQIWTGQQIGSFASTTAGAGTDRSSPPAWSCSRP